LAAAYLAPGHSRFRAVLPELKAFFLCTHRDTGEVKLPLIEAVKGNCRPDAWLGFGVALPRVQWDPGVGRVSGRWLALTGTLNFFRNGQGWMYLKRHLNLHLGLDTETLWYGETVKG